MSTTSSARFERVHDEDEVIRDTLKEMFPNIPNQTIIHAVDETMKSAANLRNRYLSALRHVLSAAK